MTQQDLQQKHRKILIETWYIPKAIEDHTNVSIEFAMECLKEVVKEHKENAYENLISMQTKKYKTIDEIVLNKIKELQNDKATTD